CFPHRSVMHIQGNGWLLDVDPIVIAIEDLVAVRMTTPQRPNTVLKIDEPLKLGVQIVGLNGMRLDPFLIPKKIIRRRRRLPGLRLRSTKRQMQLLLVSTEPKVTSIPMANTIIRHGLSLRLMETIGDQSTTSHVNTNDGG